MSKSTGKSFEILTQEIYQAFLDFDISEYGYKKTQVQHNVKIKGKSGAKHQIDVFWEFKLAGIDYCTLVEAKDWKSPVKKEQVLSLKSKMDDIPNSNGVVVSQTGFQKGAKIYAEHQGIRLISITEDTDFRIALNFITTNYTNTQIKFEMNDLYKLQISTDHLKRCLHETCPEDLIVITPDKHIEKLFDLMCTDAESYYYSKNHVCHYIDKNFEGDWYLLSKTNTFPLIKIYGYSFDCYNTSDIRMLTIKKLPILCIKDILNGTEMHYNKETKSVVKSGHIRINA